MPESESLTYSVEEVARLLRIGRNQAYDSVKSGVIPSIRIGKRILIPRAALHLLLNKPQPNGI
jgi:excisionase family DNA binding protein